MNWDAVGAIAELVGAIAVVLSLVYLARQIRSSSDIVGQNTKATLTASETSSMDQALEAMKIQIESREISEIARKGHANIADLDSTERHRYSLLLTAIFEIHQTYFVQSARGSAGAEIWEYYSRVFDKLCTLPGVTEWWRRNGDLFDPGFREYIELKIDGHR